MRSHRGAEPAAALGGRREPVTRASRSEPANVRFVGFKATRRAIEGALGGEVVEGTAEQVDAEDLDALGRYMRVPTGWGGFAPN